MEVAAHFESDDDYNEGGEHEAGGSDSETSEGGSRRPIFIRRPCGRGPNGEGWEGDTGPHHSPSPLTTQPSPLTTHHSIFTAHHSPLTFHPHPHPHPHPPSPLTAHLSLFTLTLTFTLTPTR